MLNLNAEFFESLVGHTLTIDGSRGAEAWRIESVTRREAHRARADAPFNVYLTAPGNNDRKQGMRSARLANGEQIDFFAVPVASSKDGVSYEVIFN